jgi:hypothetical protein
MTRSTDGAKKKCQSKASRTGLLKAKRRNWQEKSTYGEIFIVPTRKKHDSGWMCMAIVGVLPDGSYEQAAWCDDICWDVQGREGYMMRSDCTYPGGILHFWGARYEVGCSLSSTDIKVTEAPR